MHRGLMGRGCHIVSARGIITYSVTHSFKASYPVLRVSGLAKRDASGRRPPDACRRHAFSHGRCVSGFEHTYRTGEASLTVLNTSKPPKRHSPLGDKKIDEGRRLPCVLAPDALMNLRAF